MATPVDAKVASPVDSEPDLDFDEPLGAAQGVVAYSNLDDYYFSGEKAFLYGVYTGYKYQCVEYARRYMMLRQRCIFGQCGPAAEIFAMTTVENVEDGKTHPFIACKNKETKVRPEVGMVLVYPQTKKMPVGHVAIIAYVGENEVGIAEQNQESKNWKGKPYGRLVPLDKDAEGRYHLREIDPCLDDSSGWLYIEGEGGKFVDPLPDVTEEMMSTLNDRTLNNNIYPPVVTLPQFIEPATRPKKIARFSSKPRIPNPPTFEHAADPEAKEHRLALVKAYYETIEKHYEAVKAKNGNKTSNVHHHEKTGPQYRRAGVARSGHWTSEYVPNEPLGVAGIGDGHRCFMAAEKCAADTIVTAVKASPDAAAALAARFNMPVAAVIAAGKQLVAAQESRASVALSAADCLLGTLAMFHDFSTDSNRILHAELDSLNLLIDINALQSSYGADVGRPVAWRMTTFGNDFNRAFKNMQKFRVGRHEADLPLVFLDFGSVEDLKQKHNFAFTNEEEAYQYTVERLNHLYLAACLKDFLAEKRQDLANGDLVEKDTPKWSVVVVEDALAKVSLDAADGRSLVVEGHGKTAVAWKCAPWWAVFEMAEKSVAGAKVVLDVATKNEQFGVVMQPLWTHVTSHPAFLPHLAAWAKKHDATATDGHAVSNRVVPIDAFPDADENGAVPTLPPRCTLLLPAHNGMLDPELPPQATAEPRESTIKGSDVPDGRVFSPAMQLLIAGGKRACACSLEAREGDDKANPRGCDLYEAVHPAPLTFMRFLKQD